MKTIKSRASDQVAYYSSTASLIGLIDYNEYERTKTPNSQTLVGIRTDPEPGHGKRPSDTETNIIKSQNTNARNAGIEICNAEGLIKVTYI